MRIDPEPTRAGPAGGTLVIERPGAGLARGKYAAPPWFIGLLGGIVLIAVVAYFAIRFRKRSRS